MIDFSKLLEKGIYKIDETLDSNRSSPMALIGISLLAMCLYIILLIPRLFMNKDYIESHPVLKLLLDRLSLYKS